MARSGPATFGNRGRRRLEASDLQSAAKHRIGLTKAERERLADLIDTWPTS